MSLLVQLPLGLPLQAEQMYIEDPAAHAIHYHQQSFVAPGLLHGPC